MQQPQYSSPTWFVIVTTFWRLLLIPLKLLLAEEGGGPNCACVPVCVPVCV